MKMKDYEHVVHYYETDKMNCVHHSNYIRWFEEARTYYLAEIGYGYDKMEGQGIMSPLVNLSSEFKSMAYFGDTVLIKTKILKYTGSRVSFGYEIRDKKTGVIRCTGETNHCFINMMGRPVAIKKSLKEMDAVILKQIEKQKNAVE